MRATLFTIFVWPLIINKILEALWKITDETNKELWWGKYNKQK